MARKTNVSKYERSDGTKVSSHERTLPNAVGNSGKRSISPRNSSETRSVIPSKLNKVNNDYQDFYDSRKIDENAGEELKLHIDNDGDLYRQLINPTQQNLAKKWKKNEYDSNKAIISFKRIADQGAKSYVQQYGGSMSTFDPETRRYVAFRLKEDFEDELKLGNY